MEATIEELNQKIRSLEKRVKTEESVYLLVHNLVMSYHGTDDYLKDQLHVLDQLKLNADLDKVQF